MIPGTLRIIYRGKTTTAKVTTIAEVKTALAPWIGKDAEVEFTPSKDRKTPNLESRMKQQKHFHKYL